MSQRDPIRPETARPRQVEFGAGMHIDEAAIRLCEAAEAGGEAVGMFNDIELYAAAGYAPAAIVAFFHDETARRSEAYRKSPEGIKAAQECEDRRSTAQQTHDALMKRLPQLDMTNDHDVLDWLCEMQGPSDHIGVLMRRQTIVNAFERAGYVVGANCGADYKPGDRDNMHRYLVGQALHGLAKGPAIHGILHKFADEWRAAFPRARGASQ